MTPLSPPPPLPLPTAGRATQPYEGGQFRVEVKCHDTFFTAAEPPRIHFKTRVWHPFVDFAEGGVCAEFWGDFYKAHVPPEGNSLLVFANTLKDFLEKAHDILAGDAVAVNSDASRGIQEAGGAPFDERARAETDRYAAPV